MFQFKTEETTALRLQFVTSKAGMKDSIVLKPNCMTAADELTTWLELQGLPDLPVSLVSRQSFMA
jgi:hypothetical protein